jgi:hypothetical protein
MLPLLRRARPAVFALGEYVANGVYGPTGPCSAAARRRPSGESACRATISWPTPTGRRPGPRRSTPRRRLSGRGWCSSATAAAATTATSPGGRANRAAGRPPAPIGVLQELQHLDVGDVPLDGATVTPPAAPGSSALLSLSGRWCCSLPEMLDGREVDPRAKPRAFFDCSWALVLVPEGERVTRLLVRSRIRWGRPGHSTAPGSLWSATP